MMRVLYCESRASAIPIKVEIASTAPTSIFIVELTRFAIERDLILAFAVSDKTVSRIPAFHGHRCWTRHNKIVDGFAVKNSRRIDKGCNERVCESRAIGRNGNDTAISG